MTCKTPVKFAITARAPIYEVSITPKTVEVVGGFEAGLLKLLLEFFAPCHEILVAKDREWGRVLSNGTWTGIVGMVQRNEADIALSNLATTELRATVADFTVPYNIYGFSFATKAPGNYPRTISVFKPFSWGLWIAVLLCVVSLSVILWVLLRRRFSFINVLLDMFGIFLFRSPSIEAQRASDVILQTFSVWALVIISFTYSAVLLTFLTIPSQMRGIRYIPELSTAIRRGKVKCYINVGSFLLEIFAKSQDSSIRFIGKTIQDRKWFLGPDIDSVRRKLFVDRSAVINSLPAFRHFHPKRILISEDAFVTHFVSLGVAKKFHRFEALNEVVHRINAAGLYQKSYDDYFFKYTLNASSDESEEISPLSVSDTKEVFIILICGYVASIVVFAAEKIFYKTRKYFPRMT